MFLGRVAAYTCAICLCVVAGVLLFYQTGVAQRTLRAFIEKEMSKNLQQPITIGALSGNLVTQATLHDVRFYNKPQFGKGVVLKIKTLTAHYTLLRAIQCKGDFAKASSVVEMKDVTLHVIRNLEDDWNVFHLLPPPNPMTPPTFVGKMKIENLTILYTDYKGWAKAPLSKAFRHVFTDFRGVIDYKDLSRSKLFLIGKAQETQSPIQIDGLMNTYNGLFTLRLTLLNIDVKTWGPYVLPIEGVQFLNGKATLRGIIKTKKTPQDMPFWYDIKFTLNHTDFTLPFLKSPVLNGKGKFHLIHKTEHVHQLEVMQAQGQVHRIPLQTQGHFSLNQGTASLEMQSVAFELKDLWDLFHVPIAYSTQASTRFQVTGSLENPLVKGELKTKNMLAQYRFQSHLLELLMQAQTPLGKVELSTALETGASPVKIAGTLRTHALPLGEFGTVSGQVAFQGNADVLAIHGEGKGNTLDIYGQTLKAFQFSGRMYRLEDLDFHNIDLWWNGATQNEAIHATGNIKSGRLFQFFFEGKTPFSDVDPQAPASSKKGHLQVTGSVSGVFQKGEVLVDSLSGYIQAKLKHYSFFGHGYEDVSVQANIHQGQLALPHFSAKNELESVVASGHFYRQKIQDFSLSVKELQLAQKFIQLYIPLTMRPFDGRLSLDMSMQRRSDNPSANESVSRWKQLENYSVTGSILMTNGLVQGQPIETLSANSFWDGSVLHVYHAALNQGSSTVALHGQINAQKNLDLTFEKGTYIKLSDFQTLTSPLGQLSGDIILEGNLKGTRQHPVVNIYIDAKPFKSTYLDFDQVKGTIVYDHGYLSVSPLVLNQGKDVYQLNGHINISPFFEDKLIFSNIDYKMDMSVKEVDLDSFAGLIEALQKEIRQHLLTLTGPKPLQSEVSVKKQEASLLSISDPSFQKQSVLLFSDKLEGTALALYSQLKKQYQDTTALSDLGIRQLFKGQLSMTLSAQSRGTQSPIVEALLYLTDLEVAFLKSKLLTCLIKNTQDAVNIDLDLAEGSLGNKHFDKAVVKTALDPKGTLTILETRLQMGSESAQNLVSGTIPLSAFWNPESQALPMHLYLNFTGSTLGLLSILNPNILEITNEGTVSLTLDGPLQKPVLNSQEMTFKNTRIFLNKESALLASPLTFSQDKLAIKNNVLILPATSMTWQGPDTKSLRTSKEMINTLVVSGNISLDTLDLISFQRTALLFDLKLADTYLYINFPAIYNGEVSLQGVTFKGVYEIPLSKVAKAKWDTLIAKDQETGPVFSGRMTLENAEIAMPTFAKKTPKPSILLNISTAVQNDVTIVGSLFGDDLLSGIANTFQLSMAPTVADVKVSGSLNTPKMTQALSFSEGTVGLFNREFTLLSVDKQQDYYPGSELKSHKNTLSLTTLEDPAAGVIRIFPVLDILAVTVVEKTATSSTTKTSDPDANKDKHVVVLIKGPLYNPKSFTFDKFVNDDTKLRFEATYGIQDLSTVLEVLMPDFYEIAYSGQVNSDQTKRFLSQVGETGVNSVIRSKVIRPIEKQVAHNIGVTDFQLDYNVGSALFGAANLQGNNSSVPSSLGVNVIKSLLSDQLLLRVKTNLDLKGQTDAQVSEWELTYYFLRHFSLNYSQIRETLGAPFKPKLSLKYGYDY